jgi:hypothetical protein
MTQTENGTIEFRDPTLERSAGLTAADRKWMDEIVRDVNESWNEVDAHCTPILQYVILYHLSSTGSYISSGSREVTIICAQRFCFS